MDYIKTVSYVTVLFYLLLFATFIVYIAQQEDSESTRLQMQEKISDLERRLARDVAVSRDVDSLRAELQAANMKIDRLQIDDDIAQYLSLSLA